MCDLKKALVTGQRRGDANSQNSTIDGGFLCGRGQGGLAHADRDEWLSAVSLRLRLNLTLAADLDEAIVQPPPAA